MRYLAPGLLLLFSAVAMRAADATPTPVKPEDLQFFENKIRPIFVDRCYKCHSHDADKVKGGLMLDTRQGLLTGGDTGPAIEPGKPGDSLLIDAVGYKNDDLQMPPKGDRLSDSQVADLTEWVRRGAPDPRTGVALGSSAVYGGVGRQHWSFLPIQKQDPPPVGDTAWCSNPIDNFVLAKLESADMKPNPPADKRILLRRVSFDLTGLPPTDEEMREFLADTSPDAYEKVVDRLLSSPHYGERWARYWMDVARYSDTKGDPKQREDPRYPDAWTYRDYLIRAFNDDEPYNQFIVDQLAADRVFKDEEDRVKKAGGNEHADQTHLAALGFLTLGNAFMGSKNDVINDRIDVTTKAFLGLTVTCARCHDHKFDPIPTKDYYSLFGVFANTYEPEKESQMPFVRPMPKTQALVDYLGKLANLEKQQEEAAADLKDYQRSRVKDPAKRKEILDHQGAIDREIADLECDDPAAPPRAEILVDSAELQDYPVLIRGEAERKGDVVPRRFLEILSGPKRPVWKKDGGRLELAQAIADPRNPLTARVMVNRIWQQHFGIGIVATPDDLGNQSPPPTHPELLDYLASRFMAEGWSVKKLQRLIVTSSTYRESSAGNAAYAVTDPDNKLLWHYNMHRMDFEEIHDAILQIAGMLDLGEIGGKSVPLGSADFASRRAVYTTIDRRNPPELFTQFDFPNPNVPSGRRFNTTVPQQSLFLMNSPMVVETARRLAHRSDFLALDTDDERVASLYEAVYQRKPSPQEVALCLRYVKNSPVPPPPGAAKPAPAQQQKQQQVAGNPLRKNAPQAQPAAEAFQTRDPLDGWTKLAHALFQTNEAVFIN